MAFEEERQYGSLLTKVQKTCRKAYIVLQIIYYLLLAFLVLVVLAFLVVSFLVIPDSSIESFDFLSFIQLLLSSLLSLVLVRFAVLIMRDVVRGSSPFTKKQSKRIQYMSFALFAQVVLEFVSASIVPSLYFSDQLVMSVHSTAGSDPTVYINLNILVFAVILFCLSLVFEYGSLLQSDKDELI